MCGALALAGACAAPRPAARGDDADERAPVRPRSAAYDLRWGAALIGEAIERDDGARLERRERIVVRRGDAIVIDELALRIDRADGVPHAIAIERWRDGAISRGHAVATSHGWDATLDGEDPVALPPAVPFEDAIARAPAAGGFDGPVLLAGYGFAIADLTIARDDADHAHDRAGDRADDRDRADVWRATLAIDGGALEARIVYGDDGVADEIRGSDGVTSRRRATGTPAPRFEPIEVVGGSAIAIEALDRATDGARPLDARDPAPRALGFPDAAAPPPSLPGQRVARDRRGWRLVLDAGAPGALPPALRDRDRTADIAALTARVAAAIADDLGATALTLGAARSADRGDCTTHALRFAADAAAAGIVTRLVTGLRADGGALVRHRWIVAWTGARWIAVDPTYGESPARPVLVGLAVHGARAAELALTDAVVFDRLGARAIAVE